MALKVSERKRTETSPFDSDCETGLKVVQRNRGLTVPDPDVTNSLALLMLVVVIPSPAYTDLDVLKGGTESLVVRSFIKDNDMTATFRPWIEGD